MRRVAGFGVVLLVSSLLVPSSLVSAQSTLKLPNGMPSYGPLKPFLPNVIERRLSNGMTVWLSPRPGYPKIALALAIRGGLANDPVAIPGFSDLLASMIALGTKTRTAAQIAQEIAAAGGEISAHADKDDIVLSTDVPSWKFQSGISILADLAQNATFPDAQIALAKRNAANQLLGQESTPRYLALRSVERVVFASNPYGVFGPTESSIAQLNPAMLRSLYRQRFQPGRALLVVVGNFKPDSIMKPINAVFNSWSGSQRLSLPPILQPETRVRNGIAVVDRPGSVQSVMILASIGPTERNSDYAAFKVASTLYGGMFSARLDSDIREDKGYSYGAGSQYLTWAGTALFLSAASVRNAVTGAALNEFLYQLNRMATTLPDADELDRAQRHLIGAQALEMQTQRTMAAQLTSIWSVGLTPADMVSENQAYLRVNANDVGTVGKKYFPAAKQNIIMVGDKKTIKQQVAPFEIPLYAAP